VTGVGKTRLALEVARDAADEAAFVCPANRVTYERNRDDARAQLGEAAFSALVTAGQAITPEQAVAYALEECRVR
jgi:hypothetical protein